ncbi:proline-rich protein 7-like [Brienomyrus brachyistius]|uniref:proline-rich protein 7-like n=1 Tax=Brienomyrus brachyistius TaxID=42636 RepID=UPI0020B44A05|nr:proline-rich protein 7-like [Brienomyrus brachyistius]
MVMSQSTYTFLTCFAGFWVVWALIVMLCCFCSFLQRKLKRRRDAQPPEQSLHSLEMDSLENRGCPPREPVHLGPPQALCPSLQSLHAIPQGSWPASQEADVFGKPPSYEDAVLMEDPPPAYSEVLADIRGGTYTKPDARTSRELQDSEKSKTRPDTLAARAYSSLIHLPAAEHWDSLGCFLSTMDMNRNNLPLPASESSVMAPPPLRGSFSGGQVPDRPLPDQTCDLPTAILVFGRSTAV